MTDHRKVEKMDSEMPSSASLDAPFADDPLNESSRYQVVASASENVKEVAKTPGCLMRTVLKFRNSFLEKWPRLFHLTVRVLVPLVGLIGVSFFCGYFMSLLESGPEIQANDASLAETFNITLFFSSIATGQLYIPLPCIAENFNMLNNDDNEFNATELREFLDECSDQLLEFSQRTTPVYEKPTFNWILCGGEPMPYTDQLNLVLNSWTNNYFEIVVGLVGNGTSFRSAHEIALSKATGHADCTIHTAAGALFWFTVMTTMGYGNTTPETTGGRAMVYSLGFLSILLFAAVISSAGSICLAVCDDVFLRYNLKCLTRGGVAALFWLIILFLWLVFDAWTFTHYDKNNGGSGLSLRDSFWFTYISTTTVGFGDFYIDPTTFQAQDMFKFPFLFLIGFVLVANFILKLTEWLGDKLPSYGESLEATLEAKRLAKDSATSSKRSVYVESSNEENIPNVQTTEKSSNEHLEEAVVSPTSTLTENTTGSFVES